MNRKMRRILAFVVTAVQCAVMLGCSKPAEEKPADMIAHRRDLAEAYMRKMATVMWRATEDVVYTVKSDTDPATLDASQQLRIYAGRLYRGIPYSYAMGSLQTFLDYGGAADDKGVIPVSGLRWEAMSGSGRLGNDCSSAVILSWSQFGASITPTNTKYMCPANGFLRVGEYKSQEGMNLTVVDCAANGPQVMFEAYAKLQKADAVVRRGESAGHTMMIVSVDVQYREDGSVDGNKSKVTVLEQTRTHLKGGEFYYSEQYGENVYVTYGVDVEYTFQQLYNSSYLPITCKELIDPAPASAETVTFSGDKTGTKENILEGTVLSTWFVEAVTVTVTDQAGQTVQQATAYSTRGKNKAFELSKFLTDPAGSVRGNLAPEELAPGSYHCKVECRMTTGRLYTVREFDFTA